MVRLGRLAKDIVVDIGERLMEVKKAMGHGNFKPWVAENCMFSYRTAADYLTIAKVKMRRAALLGQCSSIREVHEAAASQKSGQPDI